MAYCAYCGSHVAQVSFVPCASCGNPTNGAPPRPVRSGNTNVVAIVIGVIVGGFALVAIIGILAAIAVPNFITAKERAKQKRTMADMRVIATALDTYGTEHEREEYPQGTTVAELRPFLQPYVKTLPTVDGWGHPLRYLRLENRGYAIASGAKDGLFEHESLDEYSSGATQNFDCDIVYANGEFVQYPDRAPGGGR